MRKLRTALALFLVMSCIHSTIVPAENFSGEAVTFVETEAVNQDADLQGDLQEDTEKLDSQDEYFYEEQEVSGILLSVKADPGVFPKDAKLRVKVVNKVEEQKKVETAVEKIAEGNLKDSIILDISILDKDGVEIQPDTSKGEVMVNFSQIPFWNQDGEENISIFHLDELGAEAEKIEDISLNEEEKSVEIRATHFSLFIISATYAGYSTNNFGLYAGEEGNIEAMFRYRNAFSGDPEFPILSVRSENPDIVQVGKNAKNEFVFKALKEGKARIYASKEIEDRIVEEKVEVLVQKALTKGKIGENIEFEITGSGNDLTLSFKGYGTIDAFYSRLWEPYKDKISTVIIGEGIETFGGEDGWTFYYMKNIRHVQLPSTLQEIPKFAFYFCDELGDVNIPPSVKKIGERAFLKHGDRKNTIYNHSKVFIEDEDYNKYITTVVQDPNLQSTEEVAQIRDFKIYTIPEIEKCFFELETSGDKLDGDYYLYITEEPREITVEDFADKNYTDKIFNKDLSLNLWKVDIRDSKDGNIKKRYFYTSGFAYNSLNGKIKPGHTYYCGILNRNNKKYIPWESRAVYQKKIQVGEANILPHEDGGFRWSAKKEGDTNVVRIQGNGRLKGIKQNGDLYAHTKMSFCLNDVHLELQGNITALDPHSLEGFRDFTGDLRLPDSIEEIGEGVFADKSLFRRLIFPSRLKAIGKKAFQYFGFWEDITLPEGLKSIGEEAFVNRSDKENIIIPSSVQYIGNSAFFRSEYSWHGTKNTITNYSPVRLTERYINPYFTDVIWKNSSNDPSSSTGGNVGANTSGSSGRTGATVGLGGTGGSSSSGGSGGSSSSGGSGGSSSSGASGGKVIISGGNPKVLGVDREVPSIVNWQRNAKGWWILYADGTYPKAQWLWLNHCWYYFNQDGYMLIGWQFINNSWYYFEENEGSEQGKMCIGWKQIKEDWYYFTEEDAANIGKMCTAWKEIRNKWYFFNPVEGKDNGKMLSNTKVDGYTLAVDGAWNSEVQRAV